MIKIHACEHCATVGWFFNECRIVSLNGKLKVSFGGTEEGCTYVLVNCPTCFDLLAEKAPTV